MRLTDELLAVGLTKQKLAELLDVSYKTVQRMGEDVSAEVLDVITGYKPEPKEPSELTDADIKALLMRRGGLEGETKPPKKGETSASWGKETDYEICQTLGIKVWEFNKMIEGWIERNPWNGKSSI